MRYQKLIAAVLCAVMAFGLCACQGNSIDVGSTKTQKGRYVEKNIALSDEIRGQKIFQISEEEGNLVAYTKVENQGKMQIHKYTMNGENFVETTPEWLKAVSYEVAQYSQEKVIEGENPIFYYSIDGDEIYRAFLFTSTDGKTVSEITPEDWTVPDPEYNYYQVPQSLDVTKKGKIVSMFYDTVITYDLSGAKLDEMPIDIEVQDGIAVGDENFALMEVDSSYRVNGVAFFTPGKKEMVSESKIDISMEGNSFVDFAEDGTVSLACGDGIFELGEDNTFTKIVDGRMTSLADLEVYAKNFIAGKNDIYYILYSDMQDNMSIAKYEYDATAPAAPDKELTVYALRKSFSLQQAAVMYQKEHPDTLVTLKIALSDGDDATKEADAVQRLLTDLIAGNGTDVLVMDGLPVDSFIDKGLLTDLSSIVDPLEENGELYNNICETYRQEDKMLPIVPTRFAPNLLVSKTFDATKVTNLHEFAEEVSKADEKILGPLTYADLVNSFLPYNMSEMIKDKQLNEELLSETLTDLKKISEKAQMVDEYSDNAYQHSVWDIAYCGSLFFYPAEGYAQSMLPIAACKLVGGSYTYFGNTYTPSLQIAVNKSSKQQDVAKEFVKCMLSVGTQSGEHYEGFPVNRAGMETIKNMDFTNFEAYTDIRTGADSYDMFHIESMSKEDVQNLADMCEDLSIQYITDEKMQAEVLAVLPRYVDGSMSPEDAIKAVKNNVALYLAE